MQYVLALLDQLLAGAILSPQICMLLARHAYTAVNVSVGASWSKIWSRLTHLHMQAPAVEQHLWLAVDSSRANYFHKTGSSADPYTILLR